MNNFMQIYNDFRQNPLQMLMKKYNIPNDINVNDPNSIIQHLLNTGQISQSQLNNVMGLRNNPMIQNLMK